jgi:protein-S-isoprenylcysteine O-methyltransferase Ste14
MNKKLFFELVMLCILTHLIRSVYEILKFRKIIKPDKLSFVIIFANMIILWVSWFSLCSFDMYRIELLNIASYLGLALLGIGLIVFLVALLTIKAVENYHGDLMTKGIYSKIRHPMYLGFILWLIGFPIYQGAIFSFILSFVFIANVLFWRYIEEKELEERFANYKEYKGTTFF